MGSCNDDIGQTLPQRLLVHAELHQDLIEFDYCEQRRWADDLREAAAELVRLQAEATNSERRAITSGDLLTRQCIVMQAALIEQATGKGDDAALEWISNALEEPGLLPDLSEAAHLPKTPVDGPAQAWFDAKMAAHLAPALDAARAMIAEMHDAHEALVASYAPMLAELAELRRWKSTATPRLAAQTEANGGLEAIASLASERAANAVLTSEGERLRAALDRIEVCCDIRAGLLTPEAYCVADALPGMRAANYDLDEARRLARRVLGPNEKLSGPKGPLELQLGQTRPTRRTE